MTIGPLTNAGLLFSQHPDAAGLLKGLVLMGGVFGEDTSHQDGVEWNVAGDIKATEIVYSAPVDLHRSVGLDVTQQVMMTADAVRRQFTAPILQPVLDFAKIWFEQFFPSITFHDPLAAATVFKPELCDYAAGQVTIDREDKPGRTIFKPGNRTSDHQIAVEVDVQAYFDHFFKIVGR